MPNQLTSQAEQPPPPLPGATGLNEQMNNYLRTFSLWCRNSFRQRQDKDVATAGILFVTPNGSVYQVTVSNAGVVTATAVPLGIGKP
jgi:hypothetical protein